MKQGVRKKEEELNGFLDDLTECLDSNAKVRILVVGEGANFLEHWVVMKIRKDWLS